MNDPIPMPGLQGLQNPYAPLPVQPHGWQFMKATINSQQAIMMVTANPHAMATHWFTLEDFDKFLQDAQAARSGIVIARN